MNGPSGTGDSRNTIHGIDDTLINGHLREMTGLLVKLDGVCLNTRNDHISSKVARKIAYHKWSRD
jgi:hypothetical protein